MAILMKPLDPWYVTGFCDGEAAFTYSRAGGTIAMYFGIKQRADNRQVVEEIRNFFGNAGYIYQQKKNLSATNISQTKPSAYFRVTKINELSAIIDHFDKYTLQSKKKQMAYKIWREMVMHKKNNYRRTDYDKMKALAEKLSGLASQNKDIRASAD